jgi:hypothetical protein
LVFSSARFRRSSKEGIDANQSTFLSVDSIVAIFGCCFFPFFGFEISGSSSIDVEGSPPSLKNRDALFVYFLFPGFSS